MSKDLCKVPFEKVRIYIFLKNKCKSIHELTTMLLFSPTRWLKKHTIKEIYHCNKMTITRPETRDEYEELQYLRKANDSSNIKQERFLLYKTCPHLSIKPTLFISDFIYNPHIWVYCLYVCTCVHACACVYTMCMCTCACGWQKWILDVFFNHFPLHFSETGSL